MEKMSEIGNHGVYRTLESEGLINVNKNGTNLSPVTGSDESAFPTRLIKID